MRIISKGNIKRAVVCAGVVMLAAAMTAYAGDNKSDKSEAGQQPLVVVAHLSVPGSPAVQMRLQQANRREYLYLVRSSGTGFTVVDVTDPKKAEVLKRVTLPPGATTQDFGVIGSSLGMLEESNQSGRSLAHPESIQFLDLSSPSNPRTVKTFTGVTSVLSEDGRRLVYLTNNDGLWILRRPTRSTQHRCTSSDDIAALPDCD